MPLDLEDYRRTHPESPAEAILRKPVETWTAEEAATVDAYLRPIIEQLSALINGWVSRTLPVLTEGLQAAIARMHEPVIADARLYTMVGPRVAADALREAQDESEN